MRPPALLAAFVLLTGAGATRLSGQVADSAAARPDSVVRADSVPQPARVDSTVYPKAPVSPMGALLRSILVPGWGQAKLHRKLTGALFVTWEGVTLGMALKTNHELQYLRRTGSGSVKAKEQERQDWLVLLAFNHLFSGIEAYVSSHLWDFPDDLQISAAPLPDGGFGAAIRVPHPAAMNAAPIGIFDSGIGGLTVARAIYERLPGESTIYFGDTARVPYGPKSPETVRRYSREILQWLVGQGVKMVVIACNTSTAHALTVLRAESPVPVIGVIEPGARAAVAATSEGPVGVIGTAGTIASNAYARAIHALRPALRVEQVPCPLFVPLAEEGWFDHPATELAAREYLKPLQQAKVDVLVLGCTHYPLLKPLLGRVMGSSVRLIDSAEETARAVSETLGEQGLEAPAGQKVLHRFVVSDDEPRFRQVGSRFIGEKLGSAEVVTLG